MPRGNLTFRVFVSSTFTDMRTERRILQEDVFPRLKALCEGKGATFQDVDLRWGFSEESQLDQKTTVVCPEGLPDKPGEMYCVSLNRIQ